MRSRDKSPRTKRARPRHSVSRDRPSWVESNGVDPVNGRPRTYVDDATISFLLSRICMIPSGLAFAAGWYLGITL